MLKKTVGQTQRQKAEIAKLKGAPSFRPLSPYSSVEPNTPNTNQAKIITANITTPNTRTATVLTPDAHTTTSTTTANPTRPARRAPTLAMGKPLIDQFNSEGGEGGEGEQPSGPSP